jgi:hypothetical protein
MKFLHWLAEEAKAIASVTLYFAACFIVNILLKQLWLADYGIEFSGIATALVAALITAKVVIVLDQIPLTGWLQGSPGIVEVITRSALYTTAVLVAMLCEKAFESRAEQGDLISALANVFDHPDMPKLWATALAVGLSFLAYNAFELVRRAIGAKRMVELFLRRNATVG